MDRLGIRYEGKYEQPAYQTHGSACFDLRAEDGSPADEYYRPGGTVGSWILPPQVPVKIPTGCYLICNRSYKSEWRLPALKVSPRSSLAAKHKIGMLNSPATIDADYKDQIHVILINHGDNVVELPAGERIAQAEQIEVIRLFGVEVLDVERKGGFGSTGGR